MLFVAGLYSLMTMPRREDPKITIRTGIVAAVYPGASVGEVEDQVTSKIEERLFRFEEVRREKTFSTSRNGMVIINVELNKSVKDPDQFWSKLRLDMAQLKATGLHGRGANCGAWRPLRPQGAEGLRANRGIGPAYHPGSIED
jgi:multidrug efflux pump subunit AcrB